MFQASREGNVALRFNKVWQGLGVIIDRNIWALTFSPQPFLSASEDAVATHGLRA
jgi:hypothetical protein